jgi:hypothetical protein
MRAARCDLFFCSPDELLSLRDVRRTFVRPHFPLSDFESRFPLVLMYKTAYYLLFMLDFGAVKNLSKTRDMTRAVPARTKIAEMPSGRANSVFSPCHVRGNPNRPAFWRAVRFRLKLKRCFIH